MLTFSKQNIKQRVEERDCYPCPRFFSMARLPYDGDPFLILLFIIFQALLILVTCIYPISFP